MLRRIDKVNMPCWALSYLINGDKSGMEDEDIMIVDEWLDKYTHVGYIDFECADENPFFTSFPEFGKPCDCEEYYVYDDSLVVGDEAEKMLGEILESPDGDRYPKHLGMAGYYKANGRWCAFDNSSGDCWVEDFDTKKEAVAYVNLEITD